MNPDFILPVFFGFLMGLLVGVCVTMALDQELNRRPPQWVAVK